MSDVFLTWLVTLLTGAIGYVAANFEKWRQDWQGNRRRRREAIGQALSVLLEVHGQAALYLVIEDLLKMTPDVGAKRLAMRMLEGFVPDLTPLHKEYEEAIKSLAGEYPVLASSIRDCHRALASARLMVSMVASEAPALGTAQSGIEAYSGFVHAAVFDFLDAKVQKLATEHGKTTQNEVLAQRQQIRRLKWELVTKLEAKLVLWAPTLPEDERQQALKMLADWRKALPPSPSASALTEPAAR